NARQRAGARSRRQRRKLAPLRNSTGILQPRRIRLRNKPMPSGTGPFDDNRTTWLIVITLSSWGCLCAPSEVAESASAEATICADRISFHEWSEGRTACIDDPSCFIHGHCTPRSNGDCVVGSDVDCLASELCASGGRCRSQGSECVNGRPKRNLCD